MLESTFGAMGRSPGDTSSLMCGGVVVVDPRRLKAGIGPAGNKTDRRDAKALAELLAAGYAGGSLGA